MKSMLKPVSVLLLSILSLVSIDTFAADSKGTVFITGANRGIGLSLAQQYYITRKNGVDTPVDKFFRKISGRPEPLAAGEAVEIKPNAVKKKKKPKPKKNDD